MFLIVVLTTLCNFALFSTANTTNCSISANNTQFLWKVTSTHLKVPSYLFGTIHVPYKQIWNQVPQTVKQVFSNSRNVVFELELQKEETFHRLAKCKNLPNLERIHQHIGRDIYNRLKKYIRTFKQYVQQWFMRHASNHRVARENARRLLKAKLTDWERKKPIWILFLLYGLEHPFDDIENVPMFDVHLAQLSRKTGKRVFALESPEEQCDPLSSVSSLDVEFAINYTLAYLESVEAERVLTLRHVRKQEHKSLATQRLIESYKCGSLEASLSQPTDSPHFIGFGLSPNDDNRARQIDAKLRDDIINKRNIVMSERIQSFLTKNNHKSFFFAVGTGHFFGDTSIVGLLQKNGYTVTSVGRNDLNILEENEHPEPKKFNSLWIRSNPEPPFEISEKSHAPARTFPLLYLFVVISMQILFIHSL